VDDLQSTLQILLALGIVVFCIMPLVLFALVVVMVRRYLRGISTPDIARITAEYEAMRAAHPGLTTDQLVRQVIRRQAFRCGVIGAITGFGGFFTLIIGLPIDILASTHIQASMVQFIATAYGRGRVSETELRARQLLILSGGGRLVSSTSEATIAFATRFISKSLAKFIPLIGAVISFAVNYAFAQAAGNLAQRWYSGQIRLAQRRD
jgi:uncharacterized protein (DUF697 family)